MIEPRKAEEQASEGYSQNLWLFMRFVEQEFSWIIHL